MLTPKQERNGVGPGVEGHNTAVPGPDTTSEIKALTGSAMALGTDHYTAAEFGRPPDRGVVDWEVEVAGHDMPGEA
jgi:hypothetical protein